MEKDARTSNITKCLIFLYNKNKNNFEKYKTLIKATII